MMQITTLFLLVLPLVAVKTGSEDALGLGLEQEAEGRPIMKVVKLLQDMKGQLQADLDDDKDVHEKMVCWCETNEKEKTKAIEDGQINIQSLKAFLGEAAGKIAELKVNRKETKDELASDEKGLGDATALRMKDNKAFAKDEKDTVVAIKATKDAITVLSKHNSLVEVREVAAMLQQAKVDQMAVLDNLKRAALKDFVRDAQGATSFLAIPGFKSAGGQSGQIFGILKQMLDDFEDHLAEISNGEKMAVRDFNALKSAKEDQISDGKKDVIDLDKRLGTTGEKQAQAVKDLKDAKEQLENDQEFLSNLKTKCSEHNEEFDTRIKDRLTEIEAVEQTINFLNDEDSFKLFDKTLSFLQTSEAEAEKTQEQMRRQSAALTIERVAAQTDSPILAMLAGKVRLDAFTEVKKAISGMVAELEQQQKDEVAHKAWCVKELNDNKKDSTAADAKKDSLSVKRDDLKASIETFGKKIEAAKTLVSETKIQMARASDTREAANNDYQQTITDQRMTQMILNKALSTMKQVYALMQNGHHRGAPNMKIGGNAPAKFKKNAAKNAGGGRVVSMIEGIIGDSKKAEADAVKAEQNAQTTYETFMLDSNKALEKTSEKIMTLSGNRAKAEEDINMTKKDLAATVKKIGNLAAENDDLHGSCDFVMDNFQKRQDARQAETDALKEAMAILSGAK